MPRGKDIPFTGTVKFQIYSRAKNGEKLHAIATALNIDFNTAKRLSDPKRIKEIESTGCFTAQRKGVVGRKLLYNKKGK